MARPAQLHYIGYCQGSTAFLVLGSERAEYMDKIKTFVGLAPVAFVRDVRSFPVRLFSLAPSKVTVGSAGLRHDIALFRS